MRSFDDELRALRDASLLRRLRPLAAPQHVRTAADGRPVFNFSSNDYLGLAAQSAAHALIGADLGSCFFLFLAFLAALLARFLLLALADLVGLERIPIAAPLFDQVVVVHAFLRLCKLPHAGLGGRSLWL